MVAVRVHSGLSCALDGYTDQQRACIAQRYTNYDARQLSLVSAWMYANPASGVPLLPVTRRVRSSVAEMTALCVPGSVRDSIRARLILPDEI